MKRSLFGKWAEKAFARFTGQKPSGPSATEAPSGATPQTPRTSLDPRVSALIKAVNNFAAKKGLVDDRERECRAEMLEFILPRVVKLHGDQQDLIDKAVKGEKVGLAMEVVDAKEWAFAMAACLGMVAGFGLDEGDLEGGVKELVGVIAQFADVTSKAARNAELPIGRGEKVADNSFDKAAANKEVVSSTNAMIQDLEDQLATESDAAAKIALKSMIDNLKKDVEARNAA